MIIKEILAQLETAKNPVARALSKGEHFKVLAIAFKKGMTLKEHQTQMPAKLFVLQGSVIYQEGNLSKNLAQFEETEIPVQVVHSVFCQQDALCLLIQNQI